NRLGYNARANIASEIETFVHFDKETCLIAISQSGETMDVIIPLKNAKAAGAKILSIVNVPYSTIQRLSDISLEVLAGQEVCVASTKAYTNQVITLLKLAHELGNNSMELDKIPERIEQTIDHNEEIIKNLAEKMKDKKDIFVLGKAISYPMAREIALKLKEISYIHAEGMMAGELKHGTIALIEQGTPVITLIPNKNPEMLSSTKEVEARGAAIIAITNQPLESQYIEILLPKSDDAEFAIYSCIIGHLLSYYIAKLNGLEIDRPRNLAKCVSVP
ncbi:MAG: SIS domain-containing protein, partial [Nanoarchaeota archaeon]